MCRQTMASVDSSSNNSVLDDSSNDNSFRAGYPQDDSDDCFQKSGSGSLEDTLSLTCDDSLSSNMSTTFVDHDDDGEASDNESINGYPSPHLLRRRLLPLPPSPIPDTPSCSHDCDHSDYSIHHNILEVHALPKKRSPRMRIVSLMMILTVYVVLTSIDHRWVLESISDNDISQEARQWRRFLRRKAPKILRKIPNKSTGRSYTIRIRGQRLDLVMQSLDYHAQCPSVKNVQVQWTADNNQLPQAILKHKSGKVQPLAKPSTSAIFLLDEDIVISCDEIERGEITEFVLLFESFIHNLRLTSTSHFLVQSLFRMARRSNTASWLFPV